MFLVFYYLKENNAALALGKRAEAEKAGKMTASMWSVSVCLYIATFPCKCFPNVKPKFCMSLF